MDKCIICNTRKWFGKYENGKCDDCIWTENARKRRAEHDNLDTASRKREYRIDSDYISTITNTSLLFGTTSIILDSDCNCGHDHSSYSSSDSSDSYSSYSSSDDSSSSCSCDCGGCD